jgi:membrane fusion protein, multidrug efflux system
MTVANHEVREETAAVPARKGRGKAMRILLALVIVAGAVGFTVWFLGRNYESTDDAFIDGHVIGISPKVSAIVDKVYVDDNTPVTKGQILVELDPRDYKAAYLQAEGNFEAATAKVAEAEAQIAVDEADVGQADAELAVAETNAQNSDDDYHRWLALDERARSKEQMDNATAAQKSTSALVLQAKAKVTEAQAQVADAQMELRIAEANVVASQGALDQAKNNLDYCTIRARSDGVVTQKSVEEGMYVQVDQQLLAIVPTDVWVTANFKETQLDRIAPGQPVDITVDAYPGRELHGTVQSVQNGTGSRFSLLPPENATGNYIKVVQRVPVKIVLDPGQNGDMDHLLSPGMSVVPQVKVR